MPFKSHQTQSLTLLVPAPYRAVALDVHAAKPSIDAAMADAIELASKHALAITRQLQ
jgi:hypothetical protein